MSKVEPECINYQLWPTINLSDRTPEYIALNTTLHSLNCKLWINLFVVTDGSLGHLLACANSITKKLTKAVKITLQNPIDWHQTLCFIFVFLFPS